MNKSASNQARVLVAGIGNLFLGDDGFGCEVARRLLAQPLPDGVKVIDFGIRGLDLAYALLDPYDAAILLDATSRGGAPGTLYVIDPTSFNDISTPHEAMVSGAHSMDPVKAIALARSLGPVVATLRLIGCEPELLGGGDGDDDELRGELSATVTAAIEPALRLVIDLIDELRGAARGRDA